MSWLFIFFWMLKNIFSNTFPWRKWRVIGHSLCFEMSNNPSGVFLPDDLLQLFTIFLLGRCKACNVTKYLIRTFWKHPHVQTHTPSLKVLIFSFFRCSLHLTRALLFILRHFIDQNFSAVYLTFIFFRNVPWW